MAKYISTESVVTELQKALKYLDMSVNDYHELLACINDIPAADVVEKVHPIGYEDCANAMMKMWIDNIITDGEYSRIMDKLNKGFKDG